MSTPTADPSKKKKGLLSRGKTVRTKDKEEKKPAGDKKEKAAEKLEKVEEHKKVDSKSESKTEGSNEEEPEKVEKKDEEKGVQKKATKSKTIRNTPSGAPLSATAEKKTTTRTKTTTAHSSKESSKEASKEKTSTSSTSSASSRPAGRQMTRRTKKVEMPKDPEEVRKMFEEMLVCVVVDVFSLLQSVVCSTENEKRDLRKMGQEAQWVWIQSNKARIEEMKNQKVTPAALAKSLADPSSVTLDVMKKLRNEVATATGSWLDEFRQEKGIVNLVEVLVHQSNNKHQVLRSSIAVNRVRSVKIFKLNVLN
jgi:hypothetical protein